MTDTTTEPREPDNPAAWALAQHIADHPVSTIQAAFRYLNAPLAIELREEPAAVLPAPADRAAVLREAADALDNSERLRDYTDDHMGDVHAAANELRRMAAEEQPDTPAPTRTRLLSLATPCANPDCAHPLNWHTPDGCQFDDETERCHCIAFALGQRPDQIDPQRILGIEPTA